MTNIIDPKPLIGALSLPVQKARKLLFCSSLNECTTSQKDFIIGVSLVYPPSYAVPFSNASKSKCDDPQINVNNSSPVNNYKNGG